jgi:hypothetical protein
MRCRPWNIPQRLACGVIVPADCGLEFSLPICRSPLKEALMALYLVTAEYVEPGPLLPPQQVVQMVESIILPSFEALEELARQKKIVAGGLVSGARSGAFILDAASNAEVSRILMELPFWGVVKWDVTPLESFRERHTEERNSIERIKKSLK